MFIFTWVSLFIWVYMMAASLNYFVYLLSGNPSLCKQYYGIKNGNYSWHDYVGQANELVVGREISAVPNFLVRKKKCSAIIPVDNRTKLSFMTDIN